MTQPCIFCDKAIRERVVAEYGSVLAILDMFPVSPGHTLIVPIRHADDFFEMTAEERSDMLNLLQARRDALLAVDPSITGFNFGMNCGRSSGQTIMHAHMHLIPRRDGDVTNPRGGVRGVIPARQSY